MNNLTFKKLYIRLKNRDFCQASFVSMEKTLLNSENTRSNNTDRTIYAPTTLPGMENTTFASLPSWCLVAFAVSIVLAQSSIYSSYRHRSLIKLLRKISSRWLLILSLLLLATYFNKSTSSFSRIATTTWALSGWMWLITSHILIRKILRYYRTNGGNSRSIVYWGTPKAAASFANKLQVTPGWAIELLLGFRQ